MTTERSNTKIRSVPNLVRKEVLAILISLCAVCFIAAVWDAPLQAPADPAGMPPEHVKAPWIFVGIQFMLRHLPAVIAGILIPVAALVAIAGIPFLNAETRSRRAIISVLFYGLVALAALLTVWGYLT